MADRYLNMSKLTYVGGLCFLAACILGTLFCLTMVMLGLMGLESDRQTSIRGLTEMLLVGGLFVGAWTLAYRLSNRKPPPTPAEQLQALVRKRKRDLEQNPQPDPPYDDSGFY